MGVDASSKPVIRRELDGGFDSRPPPQLGGNRSRLSSAGAARLKPGAFGVSQSSRRAQPGLSGALSPASFPSWLSWSTVTASSIETHEADYDGPTT